MLYVRVPRLLEELRVAHGDGSFARQLMQLARIDLLAIDDFAIPPVSAAERNDLLELLDDRVGTRATRITSQLPVTAWHEWLNDPTLADAILDLIMHSAHKIALKGESMRKRQVKTMSARPPRMVGKMTTGTNRKKSAKKREILLRIGAEQFWYPLKLSNAFLGFVGGQGRLFEAVTLALELELELEHRGAVHEAIEDGGGHGGVAGVLAPVLHDTVRRDVMLWLRWHSPKEFPSAFPA